jgi:SAM-dependent methyltransferase
MIKQRFPNAEVVGIDGDPKILSIAQRKSADADLTIEFDQAMASELPFPDESFDRVVSSLVLHHLTSTEKRRALVECRRVLRANGELHIADWGRPQNWLMWLASRSVLLFDGPKTTADNINGRLPEFFREAAFAEVTDAGALMTVFGTLAFLRCRKRPESHCDALSAIERQM